MSKLWGGRFDEETEALVHEFNASLPFDARLYNEDVDGSIAWAEALETAGVLSRDEVTTIRSGLEQVRQEFKEGTIAFTESDEDVHTVVERRLTEIVGPVGGKLHTGRSRNDQVATDFRLWTMRASDGIQSLLGELQEALLDGAEKNLSTIMPGYTHLQRAQPVTWGHWILSHFWPLKRDAERFAQARASASVLPLGAAALAGTAFPIDRDFLARRLGFARVSRNSLDAVSDRDFAVDFLYAAALLAVHLSRFAEQLILFNTAEFGFVTLSDAYSTGSSLMPQKKNPDTLELTRGKSGRLIGHLTGLLATLKGLPSAYDKDLQEDKEPVFDAFDTVSRVLPVMSGTVRTLDVHPQRMEEHLDEGLLATDLADYLVKKGVPFRQAHELVGHVVQVAEDEGTAVGELSMEAFKRISDAFEKDVYDCLDFQQSLALRAAAGGTAPEALAEQLEEARAAVARG